MRKVGTGHKRAKGVLPAFRGTWSPKHGQGFKQGEGSYQLPDKAVYDRKAAGFSVCPVSPGRCEHRREKGKTWVQVRLHGLRKCPSSMTRRPWVEGALEPWPAKWVLSQPPLGVHVLDFKCERNHLQRGASSVGWQPAGLRSSSLRFFRDDAT